MAVFTHVDASAMAAFLTRYDVGTLVSFKGIAEGVQNSNYLLDTTRSRFILTLYEERVEIDALPWFLKLLTHCADRGLPVPRPIEDRDGVALQLLAARPACLIEFAPGISVTEASAPEARLTGAALGALHHGVADFTDVHPNALGPDGWTRLAAECAGQLDAIEPGLEALVATELAALRRDWPTTLPHATIHADLFPDNVLLLDGQVTALIDFYFACTDIRAYDLAVTHAAWCFSSDGREYFPDIAAALVEGYRGAHPLTEAEAATLPLLCRGAALRFTLTRAYDWLNTPADALVTRKDPMAFARRLRWYRDALPEQVLA